MTILACIFPRLYWVSAWPRLAANLHHLRPFAELCSITWQLSCTIHKMIVSFRMMYSMKELQIQNTSNCCRDRNVWEALWLCAALSTIECLRKRKIVSNLTLILLHPYFLDTESSCIEMYLRWGATDATKLQLKSKIKLFVCVATYLQLKSKYHLQSKWGKSLPAQPVATKQNIQHLRHALPNWFFGYLRNILASHMH